MIRTQPLFWHANIETETDSLICLVYDRARNFPPLPPRRVPVTTRWYCCEPSQSPRFPSARGGGGRTRLGAAKPAAITQVPTTGGSSISHRNPPRQRMRILVGDTLKGVARVRSRGATTLSISPIAGASLSLNITPREKPGSSAGQ